MTPLTPMPQSDSAPQLTPGNRACSNHPLKAVYFATGPPDLVARDLRRLGWNANGTALRVVAPAPNLAGLARQAALKPAQLVPYSASRALLVWVRLLLFLGFTRRAEIVCLSAPQSFRFLKLLAFSLRGRGCFSTGEGGCVELSLLELLRLQLRQIADRREQRIRALPLAVIGCGSARSLRRIIQSLRARYPGQRIHGWLPAELAPPTAELFDSVEIIPRGLGPDLLRTTRMLLHSTRYQSWIIPCTDDLNRWMKWRALLWPLRRRQIYNEMGDSFPLRDAPRAWRHFRWRFFELGRSQSWPVAVIGSASGFYLEKIAASLRKRFPESELHGWLGPLQAASAGQLFDVVHRLDSSSPSARAALRLLRASRNFRCWVVPCTDEPFGWLKFLCFLLPLRRRYLYNEVGDGFALRDGATTWRHFYWRLRYRMSFQFLSGSAESTVLERLVHVPLYGLRLLAAAPVLFRALAGTPRARDQRSLQPAAGEKIRVDLLIYGPESDNEAEFPRRELASPQIAVHCVSIPDSGPDSARLFEQVWRQAQSSTAQYLCILESQCQFSSPDWLPRLLEAFDETVAQVGPQLRIANEETAGQGAVTNTVQGAILDLDGAVRWNTNHAARFHARPEWLEVDALPWVCLLIRREALLQIGAPADALSRSGDWVNDDLCRRFSAHGWLSLCHGAVTVAHPLAARRERFHLTSAS